MTKSKISFIMIVLVLAGHMVSCSSGSAPDPRCESLSNLLSGQQERDVLQGISTKDRQVFVNSSHVVWLRELPTPAPLVGDKLHFAYLYVFAGTELVATLPVDARIEPYQPRFYETDANSLIVMSHLYSSADEQALPTNPRYSVEVHEIAKGSNRRLFTQEFSPSQSNSSSRPNFTVFQVEEDPYGGWSVLRLQATGSTENGGQWVWKCDNSWPLDAQGS